MKIYRGPSSKDLSDDAHELVARANIKELLSAWHETAVIRANISKDAVERQAVAHVIIDVNDTLALHTRLLEGLLVRSANLDKAEARLANIVRTLNRIYEICELHEEELGDWAYNEILGLIGAALHEADPQLGMPLSK